MENGAMKPTFIVIFGGGGDLTNRKLIPALFNLYIQSEMAEKFTILCVDQGDYTDDSLRQRFAEGVNQFANLEIVNQEQWKAFSKNIHFLKGDFKNVQTYTMLTNKINDAEKEWGTDINVIYYLAIPSFLFGEIAAMLGKQGLGKDKKNSRIVVEKPIGHDLESSIKLNKTLLENFAEKQIFRIDHYLGKETVQNILAFRFGNSQFEPIWNRDTIEYVTITVAETVGVEHRGRYYEGSGQLRDMVQNHLMQLLCLVAMEPPISFNADEVRNKKVDVLHSIRPLTKEDVAKNAVRGQYGPGKFKNEQVPGYRQESDVAPESNVETFVALKLFVDNWRWQDIPFYLRTGKSMAEKTSTIVICFRKVPHLLFPKETVNHWQPDYLHILIQPDEGLILQFYAKVPGKKMKLDMVEMKFSYKDAFQKPTAEAYETLLWDVIMNDATQFMREDQITASWTILQPILDEWKNTKPPTFPNYAPGSWGPETSNQLIQNDGHAWPPCVNASKQ